jgi:hypothetical protein
VAEAESIALVGRGGSGELLLTFDSATPSNVTTTPITGLQLNDEIVGIDYRPTDGKVYAMGAQSNLYSLNPSTGAATLVASDPTISLASGHVGLDWNPVNGLLYVSDPFGPQHNNYVVNPATGQFTANPNYPASSLIIDLAFSNNVPGATTTTLYGIDAASPQNLVTLDPSTGAVNPVGPVGSLGVNALAALDISGASGVAYAMLTDPTTGAELLATVDLRTGAASEVGPISLGSGVTPNGGLAVIASASAVPEPSSLLLMALGLTSAVGLPQWRRTKAE